MDTSALFIWPLFFFAAFIAVLLLAPLVRHLAITSDFVDRPGGRKRHEDEVPPIGGLVVFPVFMALSAFWIQDWSTYAWLYAALSLLIITGALDDRFTVSARVKFLIQFVAAFIIVLPGAAQVVSMGNLFGFGDVGLGFISIPFSVIAAVLLINAINLLDGMDGLAGGTGFIVLGWMAFCCALAGAGSPLTELLILCGALAGFLFFNLRTPWRRAASIFMGDSGSLSLGLIIAWYAIHLTQGESAPVQPVSVAWFLALPIMDTCGQFARRVSQGRHPFSPDHNHFHHHFTTAGVPVALATPVILLNVFVHGLVGVGGLMLGIPGYLLMYLWAGWLFLHIYMSMRPHRFRRIIQRFLVRGEVDG